MPALQTPIPPLPPGLDQNFAFGRLQETIGIIVLAVLFAVTVVKVIGPLARAWARKIEGKVGDPELRAEVDHLHEQLGEVDGLRTRVQELEERLEFAERLLTQRPDQGALPRGGNG